MVSRMDQAVQDGISDGGFPNEFMPSIDGELAGDEGGAPIITIIQDFQEIPPFGRGERCETPVIDDEEIEFGQFGQELGIRAVGLGDLEVME